MTLDYGSDHLISLFASFLKGHDFPHKELNLNNPNDFDLLSELKERTCTLDEVQLKDFLMVI
jgi:hypothetical protein